MLENMKVSECMSSPAITVKPDTPLKTAHHIMGDRRVRRLPVVTRGELVGIVTIGDVREASPSDATSLSVWELNYLWEQLKVEQAMTKAVVTVAPDTTIPDAVRLILEKKIGGMPVVDAQGNVVGILTESDIFKLLVESRARMIS